MATLFTDPRERARMTGLVSALTNDAIIADAGAQARHWDALGRLYRDHLAT